jgi:hypothetical protein
LEGTAVKKKANDSPVNRQPIGLSNLAWKLIDDALKSSGCASRGEYLEWLVLSQTFPKDEAEALWNLRRKRGGVGGVTVLPDDAKLPPEG